MDMYGSSLMLAQGSSVLSVDSEDVVVESFEAVLNNLSSIAFISVITLSRELIASTCSEECASGPSYASTEVASDTTAGTMASTSMEENTEREREYREKKQSQAQERYFITF